MLKAGLREREEFFPSFLPSSFLLRLFPLFAVIDGMMVCGARARAEAASSVSVGDGRTDEDDGRLACLSQSCSARYICR